MTKEQINKLLFKGKFPEDSVQRELIETHISWVLICDQYAYKIKKPVHYSFLDFSTIELRKHFCQREIELNKRLTDKVYMDVQPVGEYKDTYQIGNTTGKIIEYAVKMHKLNKEKQMDFLLLQDKVTGHDMQQLAKKIASFHTTATIIYKKNFLDIREKFNDLEKEKEFLGGQLGRKSSDFITQVIEISNVFLEKHNGLLTSRLRAGYFRDCHGDLHSRNIFLLPEPVPFDCIEFNDDLRQIDVLDEIAFLCMDLEAMGRQDLSALFIEDYNKYFPAVATEEDRALFIYYKSYRANIRAKVNSLRAKSAESNDEKTKALSMADQYLTLMESYTRQLEI